MKDYHPIDVRYKGPATAYVGSRAHRLRSDAELDKMQPLWSKSSFALTAREALEAAQKLLRWFVKKWGGLALGLAIYATLSGSYLLDQLFFALVL